MAQGQTNIIFQTAFLGDLLLTIPLIRRLKKIDSESSLMLVCRPGFGDLFARLNLVDDVLELDKRNVTGLQEFRDRLAHHHIRYLISVHRSVRTALALRTVQAEHKLSYHQWWNRPFYDLRVPRDMRLPEALRVLSLLAPIDPDIRELVEQWSTNTEQNNLRLKSSILKWPKPIPDECHVRVAPNPAIAESVNNQLAHPFAVIAPSSQWSTKCWTEEGYRRLAELMAERGLNVYLVGTRDERDVCDRISASVNHDVVRSANVEVRSLAGRFDLLHLHALMSQAQVVVANDSGPMHLAAVAGRPVVGIFGPTVLAQGYRPWSDQSAVIQTDLDCRPCGRHGHMKCPIGTHACMKNISAEMVMQAVEQLTNQLSL